MEHILKYQNTKNNLILKQTHTERFEYRESQK